MRATTLAFALLLAAAPSGASAQDGPASQPAAAASAAAPSWRFAVAPRVGLTLPTSKLGAMIVGGLEIDHALPVLDRRLVLAFDATITRPGYDGSGTDARVGGPYEYSVSETELKLALDLVYRLFPASRRLVPFVGAGAIAQLLETTESTSFGPGDNTEHSTNFGFEVLAGVDYRLAIGYLLGELRFEYTDLEHFLTGESNAGNVVLSAGYRFTF